MGKRLWDLAKSRIEIGTILPGHRHKVRVHPADGPAHVNINARERREEPGDG